LLHGPSVARAPVRSGHPSSAAAGAAYGGTLGVAGGAANGVGGQIEVIRNCLRGRGYSVLR